ncbi:MAG: Rieske 2Fe-2S domain-containing protein [candidate division Zixibacteria bacterium]|nr:Rieske 2Fe-2S domain-containing protein [candidate division Zixibacteria bacterium]
MSEKTFICVTSDIPLNDYKLFSVDVIDIIICNIKGQFYGVSNFCPHKGVVLSRGPLQGKYLTCSGHGYRFDVTSGECPDDKDLELPRFNLIREGDALYVSF